MILKITVALSAALIAAAEFAQHRVGLDEIVETAFAIGSSGEKVVPYRLRREVGHPPKQQVAIYTKFVRVALAAWSAKSSGKNLTVAELPKWITDDAIYAVFASPCPKGKPPCELPWGTLQPEVAPTRVGIGPLILDDVKEYLPNGLADSARSYINAKSFTTNLEFMNDVGGLPFDDATIAAVFERADFVPGFAVYAFWQFGTVRVYVGGRLTDADLRSWR